MGEMTLLLSLVACLSLVTPAFAEDEKPAAALKAAAADFGQVEELAHVNHDLAVELYRTAAQWCLNHNQAAQAAALYEAALAAAPGQARLLEELADAQLAAGKPKEAAATWEANYKASSKDVGMRVRYANFLAKAGEDDPAIKLMREIAAERPQDASMRYWIADAHARTGKAAEAAKELRDMLKQFPDEKKEVERRLGLLDGKIGNKKEEEGIKGKKE